MPTVPLYVLGIKFDEIPPFSLLNAALNLRPHPRIRPQRAPLDIGKLQ